nr:Mu transposase C-terminal domain-containing protein [Streptomyces sp. HUCO-GS316]
MRYLDPVLAAYVGEDVTIRYDPRDLAEIRVFHQDRYLTRAVCPQLAGTTISLKDITAARNARCRELTGTLKQRTSVVDRLLAVHTTPPDVLTQQPSEPEGSRPKLRRYREE